MSGPVLEVLSGELSGRSYEIDDDEFVIGRASSCHLVIPKRYISREHLRIVREGAGFLVDGLSRKNPVTVAERSVGQHALRDGDEFEVCGIRFRFRLEGEAEARRRPTVQFSEVGGSSDERFEDAPAGLDDSDSGGGWEPPPARRSSPGQVVFGDDDDDSGEEDEEDRTGELDVAKVSTRGIDAGTGSDCERTAELGGKALDPDDPEYDPFAAVEVQEKKKRQADPEREKLLRIMLGVGMLGIVIAAGTLWWITRPKEWTEEVSPRTITVELDEVARFEEPWSIEDPPSGRQRTDLTGANPYFYYRDAVAEVEWAVPHLKSKAVFLIRGLSPGETTFRLHYEGSRRRVDFTIIVEDARPHEVAREQRRDEWINKPVRELRDLIDMHTRRGDTYTKERDAPAKEGYYREALLQYELASDAGIALRERLGRQGTVSAEDTNMIRRCEEREANARELWEEFVRRERARYEQAVANGTPEQRVEQLQLVLRALNHECDQVFQRLLLILEQCYGETYKSTGREKCALR